eukprot:CAMPEP_0198228384 /NCGR_PEP_ID=MMETSP1445-20131203/112947_1 /TAXON_ID=36898 /ORGANISM="Pyramimonas sp., Strain CCMP2087" /LENGTH=143 /DNA_ID=CAMNT_0043908719 /DNA_START=52 /DNA_END=480 /DNA_ORIENTATION=-
MVSSLSKQSKQQFGVNLMCLLALLIYANASEEARFLANDSGTLIEAAVEEHHGGARMLLNSEKNAPVEAPKATMDRLRPAEKQVLEVPRALPHVFADFPISKYLFRTEEAPADRTYKEYMESTKFKRDQLKKTGGPRLAAFEK